jgi:hypothetical protein
MQRKHLTYRACTHAGKFMDEAEMAVTILDFVRTFRNLRHELDLTADHIFNMDETAVYFDNVPIKTIDERGKKSMSLLLAPLPLNRSLFFSASRFQAESCPHSLSLRVVAGKPFTSNFEDHFQAVQRNAILVCRRKVGATKLR